MVFRNDLMTHIKLFSSPMAEVRKSTEWTSWARVNETREGRIERRYKVVCKANIPQQTDLRVQVKTNERFCSAGSDETCAGERILDLHAEDGGNLDLVAHGLEPLLVLLANAVCKNSVVVGYDICCDNVVDKNPNCTHLCSNGTTEVMETDVDDIVKAGSHDSDSKKKVTDSPQNQYSGGSGDSDIIEEPLLPAKSESSFKSPVALRQTSNISFADTLLDDVQNVKRKNDSYISKNSSEQNRSLSACQNKTNNGTSPNLPNQTETKPENTRWRHESKDHHKPKYNTKECNCPKPKRRLGPPWSHNDVFKGYCKCRDLGIYRTCRKCKIRIPGL